MRVRMKPCRISNNSRNNIHQSLTNNDKVSILRTQISFSTPAGVTRPSTSPSTMPLLPLSSLLPSLSPSSLSSSPIEAFPFFFFPPPTPPAVRLPPPPLRHCRSSPRSPSLLLLCYSCGLRRLSQGGTSQGWRTRPPTTAATCWSISAWCRRCWPGTRCRTAAASNVMTRVDKGRCDGGATARRGGEAGVAASLSQRCVM